MSQSAEQSQKILTLFQMWRGKIYRPAIELELSKTEEKIGILPLTLRQLYLHCNGFYTAIGEPWLFPLDLLVDETMAFREYAKPLGGADFICFGYDEAWRQLAIRETGGGQLRIISYDTGLDLEFKDWGSNLLDFYIELDKWHRETIR